MILNLRASRSKTGQEIHIFLIREVPFRFNLGRAVSQYRTRLSLAPLNSTFQNPAFPSMATLKSEGVLPMNQSRAQSRPTRRHGLLRPSSGLRTQNGLSSAGREGVVILKLSSATIEGDTQ
jgi:hypothetical protein